MPNIKFYRSEAWPSNITPQEGFVWFNSTNNTIQLYKGGAWEVYTGKINNVVYDENGTLTITKHDGTEISVPLGDVKNISDLSTRLGNLETSFNTLSGEFETLKGTVSTNSAAVATVIKQLKNIQETEGAVKAYVDAQVSAEKTARENADSGFTTQISGLNTTTAGHTSAIDDLKTFVAFTDGVDVPTQITNAINALDNNGVTGTGSYVDVTVTQVDGKVTTVAVADGDLTTAFNGVNKAISDETTRATATEGELAGAINTEKGRIDTLYGVTQTSQGDTGKSIRNIAAEEVAKIVDDNDSSDLDTLKEIAA